MTTRGPPEERSVPELLSFGVVNLDKPAGPSAHEVAGWVRDACDDALASGEFGDGGGGSGSGSGGVRDGTDGAEDAAGEPGDATSDRGVERAAHGGTLDPKVTGCLPVLLGDATRLAQVLHRGRKEYVAVLELHASPPSDLEATVAEFEGRLYQKPPRKSAVKRELRVREVYELDVLEVCDRQVLLRIGCAAGTYVRKLCHDLGLALGTGAHMGHLRRTATTPFDDRDLVTLHELVDALAYARERAAASGGERASADDGNGASADGTDGDAGSTPPIAVEDVVQPAERALEHLPAVTIAESAAEEVANGAPVYAPGVLDADEALRGGSGSDDGSDHSEGEAGGPPLVACFTPDGAAVCLGRLVGDPDADAGTVVDLERVLV